MDPGNTLSAIAAQAGVSVSTVSKVRSGGTDVAPATRARVAALLRQHGHQVVVSAGGFGVVDMLIGALNDRLTASFGSGAIRYSLLVVALCSLAASVAFLYAARMPPEPLPRVMNSGA